LIEKIRRFIKKYTCKKFLAMLGGLNKQKVRKRKPKT
jgi:hypothetical protein